MLGNQTSEHTSEPIRYVSEDLEYVATTFGPTIEARIQYKRDYDFDYFGFKTLEKSYLLKDTKGRVKHKYRLGTPSRSLVAAGYRALAAGI
jgi:ribonucleotide reductase alpha subunit